MQNQQVLTGLSGMIPNIQYQVIPQFQTMDGQQLQFATTPTQVSVQQDASGQLQIIPGTNQQLIANRSGTGNILATMPNLLQQAVPIQGVNTLSGQTQYVTNVPLALNGNITLLPVNSIAASLAPTSQSVTLSSSGSQEGSSHPVTSSISSSSMAASQTNAGSFFTNANSYNTTTTSNVGIVNFSTGGTVGTNVQIQTPQRTGSAQNTDSLQVAGISGQQKDASQNQQQILIQPQLMQGGQAGQTFTTQDALQNLQIQTLPNTGPIFIRTPTVGPNGQVTWQTIQLQNLQVQNPQAQTIALAPVQGVSLGQTGSTNTTLTPIASASLPSGTVTVNAAQLTSVPGLQTINLGALGASGIQVHQLQGLPLAIANATGKWESLVMCNVLRNLSLRI